MEEIFKTEDQTSEEILISINKGINEIDNLHLEPSIL